MLLELRKAIKDIRLDKSSSSDTPPDILKQCDLRFQALTNCINQSIVSGNFPGSLKLTNISRVYKAKDPLDKNNYRPVSVSVLLPLFKINERLSFNHLYQNANKILSKFLCGFRKAHSTHSPFRLLQS